MDELNNGAAPVVTESVSAPVVEQAPASFEDTMSAVYDKMNQPRDDGGKFAGNETTAAPEGAETAAEEVASEEITDQPSEKEQETAQPSITAPNSWSAEMKAKFGSLPPEAQQYIAQRESEMHAAITQKGEQIKAFEPIRQTLDQHREVFAKNGVSEAEGISRFIAADRFLEQNPSAAIQWLAESYGVDLRQFSANPGSTDQSPAPPREVFELKQEINQLKSYLTAQQRQSHEAEQATVVKTVEDFAKDKPHFEKVRKIMGSLMQAGEAADLSEAYEKATYAHPEVRQLILEDQRKAAEAQRKAEQEKAVKEAKKSGAVNLKSTQGSTPAKGASFEETMSATYDRLMGNG